MESQSPLRRTPTNTSEDNFNDTSSLTAVYSASSTATSAPRPPQRLSGRTPSTHSLLAANKNPDVRKGAHSGTTKASADRSSISMPPPSTKPLADRRLSASISSALSMRKSEETARSPPASVKSLEADRTTLYSGSPTAQNATTAHDPTVVTTTASTSHAPGLPVLSPPAFNPSIPNHSDLVSNLSSQIASAPPTAPRSDSQLPLAPTGPPLGTTGKAETAETALPVRPPRVNKPRSLSSSRRLSTTGSSKNESVHSEARTPVGRIGVCALDVKARSRPSRQILTRLQGDGEFEVIVFGDKAILDEDVENWPICDYLISFFSDGFPLDKAIAYVKLRKPFVVNDLAMQKVLWDRRLCLKILDQMQIPTPKRIEVNRDGGPRLESPELARLVKKLSGVVLEGAEDGTGGGAPMTKHVELVDEGDTLLVDGKPIRKPFVEKPVNGEDHNVIIYFPRAQDGGARRLFRKIGNKSSEYDPELIVPRCITEPNSSYIYEQFLKTENAEDVKAYTVGPDYCHAETRKSPVVDGLVRRNTHGKELRYVTKLTPAEREMASKVSMAFGQRICGFDLLRTGTASYIIDVNGWSFVKDNEDYYNDCAKILRHIFLQHKFKEENAVFEEPVAENLGDPAQRRQATTTSARSALKTILKSPSMTRLSQHLPHSSRHHPSGLSGSSKTSAQTTPISSPPSVEKNSHAVIHPVGIDKSILPPPALPAPEAEIAQEPVASVKETKPDAPLPSSKHSWKLKGVVTVIRHADRTPKQKLKFTAHSQVFADLLKGHHEEVLLKGEAALASVQTAVKIALRDRLEDPDKLRNLQNALAKKIHQPGTKVQIKPMFRKRKPEEMSPDSKPLASPPTISEEELAPNEEAPHVERHASTSSAKEMRRVNTRSDSMSGPTFSRFSAAENDLVLDKLQLVMKWGGEPTHSARYQSQDLGTNMRDDFKLLNRGVLDEVRIFTSSEKRVKTSAQIWAAAFLDRQDIPEDFIQVRKDLLDDSNAAKDVMDKVKKKLKHLLREGTVPDSFAWPKDVAEPYMVMQNVVDLLRFHRRVMRHNFKKLSTGAVASLNALNGAADAKENGTVAVASIQSRWCTGEDAELFKERWEKLFSEFCDTEKADPSKISELYDTMKYDALHNKQFLEWAFTPSQSLLDEMAKEEEGLSSTASPEPERIDDAPSPTHSSRHESVASSPNEGRHSLAHKIGLRRQSVLKQVPPTPPLTTWEQGASYFKLFPGSGDSRSKQDQKLGRLRELYRYSKILFDYIGPQEYGISDEEKLEIGLLTSLPLLREIVDDLEELQASGDAKSFVYFTKESHIYTLLNCIMEGGIHTKIKRSTIPELDYLSQICFELYEAKDAETAESTYSIRISISPGCHTVDPLDVSLDSKHAIGSAPRRSLTNHQDWKEVISTLKAKFNTVQLPKSFLAVNVSDKHEQEAEMQRRASYLQSEAAKQKYTNGSANGDFTGVNAEDGAGGPQAGDALVRDLVENVQNPQSEAGAVTSSSVGQETTRVQPQFVPTEDKANMSGDTSAEGRGRSI